MAIDGSPVTGCGTFCFARSCRSAPIRPCHAIRSLQDPAIDRSRNHTIAFCGPFTFRSDGQQRSTAKTHPTRNSSLIILPTD
ncbi:hypothetical protein PCASD_17557 [Puccinia coronata f. sp. avenae]|uniref:Uncharacterized protein n=1 Tax=Puccinia coronata f. sp. avenae TaxID=200324 RepID=A0A2N5U5W0_9BASI|nr:hypothetical protein PCASD_17557 [Puccinia coronata f. sp. avenae]